MIRVYCLGFGHKRVRLTTQSTATSAHYPLFNEAVSSIVCTSTISPFIVQIVFVSRPRMYPLSNQPMNGPFSSLELPPLDFPHAMHLFVQNKPFRSRMHYI